MKNIFVLLISSFFISACSVNQNLQEQIHIFEKKPEVRESITPILMSEINYILLLLKQNDLETINTRFINQTYGFYEISKNEKENKIEFQKKIQFEEISNNVESFDIKEEEVVFNCSPYDDMYYGWNKEGIFISANTKPFLSELMKESNLLELNKYDEEEIQRAIFIEKTSYEVIIPNNMVFYITKIDNQWYITLIDNLKTDCS